MCWCARPLGVGATMPSDRPARPRRGPSRPGNRWRRYLAAGPVLPRGPAASPILGTAEMAFLVPRSDGSINITPPTARRWARPSGGWDAAPSAVKSIHEQTFDSGC
jgi:hypothetical protein